MNGLVLKTVMVYCTLLSTLIVSPLTPATMLSNDQHTKDRLQRRVGCLMCHQRDAMTSDETSDK